MKTKRNVFILVMILAMAFTAVTANAGEVDTERPEREPMTIELFEEKVSERMDEYDQRIDEILAEKTAAHDERVANASEVYVNRIEFIMEWAPELEEAFQEVFDAHIEVHEILFSTNYAKHELYHNDTMAGLDNLLQEVLADLEAELISFQEGSETLKAYKVSRHEEYQALRDEYEEEVAPLKEDEAYNKEIVEGLREELRVAVETEDDDAVTEILNELLVYAGLHIDFDYAKLAILETYYVD